MTFSLDILIPHYCDPNGLALTLGSIENQTWSGYISVVIFDDGSPFEQFEAAQVVCDRYASGRINKLKIIRSETNVGRPRARNTLLENSKSSYIAWLDAGDIWYPEKLTSQFNYLYNLECRGANLNRRWVTCDYDWTQDGKTRSLKQDVSGDQYNKIVSGESLRSYLWTLLGTAESFKIAGRFDERLPRLQDMDYFLSFVKGGGKLVSVPGKKSLCQYFKSDVGRKSDEVRRSYEIIRRKNFPHLQKYPSHFIRMLDWKHEKLFARFAYANRNYLSYLHHTVKAGLLRPSHTAKMIVKASVGR